MYWKTSIIKNSWSNYLRIILINIIGLKMNMFGYLYFKIIIIIIKNAPIMSFTDFGRRWNLKWEKICHMIHMKCNLFGKILKLSILPLSFYPEKERQQCISMSYEIIRNDPK